MKFRRISMKEYEKFLKEKDLYGMVPMKMSCRSRAVKGLPHMEDVMQGKFFQQLELFFFAIFFDFHLDYSFVFFNFFCTKPISCFRILSVLLFFSALNFGEVQKVLLFFTAFHGSFVPKNQKLRRETINATSEKLFFSELMVLAAIFDEA